MIHTECKIRALLREKEMNRRLYALAVVSTTLKVKFSAGRARGSGAHHTQVRGRQSTAVVRDNRKEHESGLFLLR